MRHPWSDGKLVLDCILVRQIGEARASRCHLLLGGDCEHAAKGSFDFRSSVSAEEVLRAALVCWPQTAQEIPALADHMQDWPGIFKGTVLAMPHV